MLVAVLALVIGLALWLFAAHPKLGEAGRILFSIGLFLALAMLAAEFGATLHLGPLR